MTHIPPRSRGVLEAQAETSYLTRRVRLPVQQYIHTESLGGLVLLAATIGALVWANSPWYDLYHEILETHLSVNLAILEVDLTLHHWINDGLMALFFFVVGLEIKREALFGNFSTPRRAALPAIAALGGMIIPAAVYLMFNFGQEGQSGWGVPMATDIAFALGVLALLGNRVPMQLRVFLLGLAVVDDLGAIFVIAVVYTESISFGYLGIVAVLMSIVFISNRVGFSHAAVTSMLGFLIWVAMLKSGVHATIAGVLFALLTPARPQYSKEEFARESESLMEEYRRALDSGDLERTEAILGQFEELSQGTESPMERLERLVHPWTSYVILPVFALANAGLHFTEVKFVSVLTADVTVGVIAGLLFGKVIGITLFPWIASKFGLVELPRYVTWVSVIGVGFLAGIGFTVALFISGLAFTDSHLVLNAQVGIMCASVVSAILGYTVLRFISRNTVRSQSS